MTPADRLRIADGFMRLEGAAGELWQLLEQLPEPERREWLQGFGPIGRLQPGRSSAWEDWLRRCGGSSAAAENGEIGQG